MLPLSKKDWLNRILVLALALLISNVAALSCAMAYALCTDASTDCPEHTPVLCEGPCARSDTQIANTSSEGSTDAFRPVIFLPALPVSITAKTYATSLVAKDDPSCEVPALPLRLRFCVFLN
jgi:hypothetical protein